MGKATHVNEQDFESQVLKATTPVLVDFWAEWCGPCRMIAPIVEELAGEYEGKLKVVKVDVDSNQDIAFPTLGIFKGGEMVERLVGYMPKQQLKRRIDTALGASVS